jgi:hypothetical protein
MVTNRALPGDHVSVPVRPRSNLAAILLVAVFFGSTLLPGAADASTPIITPSGVGALQLGATVKSLRQRGLIGGLRKGCELDPGQRVAPLRAPLSGWAIFGGGGGRLASLTIEGGAETAHGIGVGSTAAEARASYPSGEWLSPQKMYPLPVGLLWVNGYRHPKLSFLVNPSTYRVESIAVPSPNFCE